MSFSTSSGSSPNAEMNVTPLIDVLLVLLVIFMVVVLVQQDVGLNADLPQTNTRELSKPQQDSSIVVQINEATPGERPTLKVNQESIRWEDLPGRLEKIFAARVQKVAFIKGAGALDFEDVAKVIDIMRHSGAERVGLLPKNVN